MDQLTKRPPPPILAIQLPLALLVAACAAAPLPTSTPEPTPTPVPEPAAWLLSYGDEGLTLYDASSGERIDLDLPPLWMPEVDLREIPGSGLLAARVAADGGGVDLAILRLPQGDILRRIPLVSDALADEIARIRGSGEIDYEVEDAYTAVTGRWFKPRWSPDGTSIAFAASREDTGADLYVYDLQRDELRRLTREYDQAVALGWSPDGEWVVYAEAFGFEDDEFGYFPIMVGAASSRTGEVRPLFAPISGFRIAVVGWLSADQVVLVAVEPYGQTLEDLYLVDLTSGESTALYEGAFAWVDLDPQSGTLALTWWDEPDLRGRVAVMRPGAAPTPVRDPWRAEFWGLVRWYPDLHRFFAESEAGLLAFTPGGMPAGAVAGESCLPFPSPDGRYLAIGPCGEGWFGGVGLRLYTAAGRLLRELESDYVETLVWEPGSKALYYTVFRGDGPELLRAEIPGGETRLIDRNAGPALALIQPAQAQAQLVRSLPTAAATPVRAAAPAASPTPTPQRALDPGGPWLVGMTGDGPVAINADGTGRTELFAGVPMSARQGWLEGAISSAGWVAAIREGSEEEPHLLVVGHPARGIVRQIQLLTPELAVQMDEPDEDGWPKSQTQDVYLAFDSWMNLISWSPDGRTLAYVAAVDGPSADVYVYDTVNDQARRLTRGPNQPRLLGWSADGRWILHLEIQDITLGDGIWWDTLALWAAAADGSQVRKVPGVDDRMYLLHWGAPTQFLVVHYENGPLPPFQIELIDLETGPVATLYPGYVYQWAVDPATGTIAFLVDSGVNRREEGLQAGLYLASPSQPTPQLAGTAQRGQELYLGYTGEPVWSPELDAFMVTTREDRVALISTSGEVVRWIDDACHLPAPSPDRRWLALEPCGRKSSGLQVRSEEDGRTLELPLGSINDFFWSPDSAGIYYFQGEYPDPEQLLYVPIPEGTPRMIHPDSGLRSWIGPPRFVTGP